MRYQSIWAKKRILLAGLLVTCVLVSGTVARSNQEQTAREETKQLGAQSPAFPVSSKTARLPFATQLSPKVRRYYQLVWGVDIVGVKLVSSGLLVRFSYRVVDANKAKVVNDKNAAPYLFDEKTRAKLIVPTMEKVGQLRQSSPPENGQEYWMVFSNKGAYVKPGSRVDVVIGNFRAAGLVVE
jgi:hypothetical protein